MSSRKENDYYKTPLLVAQAIVDHIAFEEEVWEPCTQGNVISNALEFTGVKVRKTDIVWGQDFFDYEEPLATTLVTNPPFNCIRNFIDHAFYIGVQQMVLVCPERLWACQAGRAQFNRYRPSLWANLDWREDYLGRGGSPDRALAIAFWERPHSRKCDYEVWRKPE